MADVLRTPVRNADVGTTSPALGQAAGTAAVLKLRGEGASGDVQASLREQGAFLGEVHE